MTTDGAGGRGAWPAGTPAATLGDAPVLAAWPADRADLDGPVPWADLPPCRPGRLDRRAWALAGIASALAAAPCTALGLALLLR
jgi:hypothetical protein